MRFIMAAQTYWPIWIGFSAAGHTWLGMAVASAITAAVIALTWRLTWGTFRGMLGGDLPVKRRSRIANRRK